LAKLKELGIYDSSAIVLLGDHGSGRTADTRKYFGDSEILPVKARGNPLLMVKPFKSDRDDMTFNSSPVSFETLHKDVHSLIDLAQTLPDRNLVARRYVWYQWTAKFMDYLPDYREYMVIGDSALNRSWMPIHIHHQGFPERENCIYRANDEVYTYSRDGIHLLDASTVQLGKTNGASHLLVSLKFDNPEHNFFSEVEVNSGEKLLLKVRLETLGKHFTESINIPLDSSEARQFKLSSPSTFQIVDFVLIKPSPVTH
jgi:hypothetical protein